MELERWICVITPAGTCTVHYMWNVYPPHLKKIRHFPCLLVFLHRGDYEAGESHTWIVNAGEQQQKNVFSVHHLENAFSNCLCILLPRKTMICTPRANIHLCVCKQVQTCVFLCTRRNPLSITTLHAIHRRCSMQPYRGFFFSPEYTHWRAHTHTHTISPKSGDLMRPVETLLNCQSTLSLLTHSRQHHWLLFSNSGSLSNCIRCKENSEVHWTEKGRDKSVWVCTGWRWGGRWGGVSANLCVLHFGKLSELCVLTLHVVSIHLKHASPVIIMIYVQEQRQKKRKKAVTTSLLLPGLLAKPGLQSCSSNQQWGHVFHSRERGGGGLDIHSVCHACVQLYHNGPCLCQVLLSYCFKTRRHAIWHASV